jgi:hypothetical protein
MSSPPRIFELRISYIWTETFPTLLTGTASDAPMAFLGEKSTYANRYEEIKGQLNQLGERWEQESWNLRMEHYSDPKLLAAQQAKLAAEYQKRTSDPELLTFPWPWLGSNYIHHFWQNYFENVKPNQLQGAKAWEYVVPLRINMPVQIGSPWPETGPKCRIMVDGLFYPHGVALVIMARLLFKQETDGGVTGVNEQGVGLQRMMERALELRRDLVLPVSLPDQTQHKLSLDALASALLDYLHTRALGAHAPQGDRPSQPLSIATVIQGRGGDAMLPVIEDSDLHKVLAGLCNWREDWSQAQDLASPVTANLLIGSATPGHMVYHTTRGRAVWMPKYFDSPARRDMHKLSCYHRNLTLVSLQTEMLAQTNVYYTDYLDRGEPAPAALAELARFAAIRLGYLYAALKKGSKKYTYNSASPRFYLEENPPYVDIINQARADFKLSALAYKLR